MVSRSPYVTGTSVLGIKYKDGVLLASDTAGGLLSVFLVPWYHLVWCFRVSFLALLDFLVMLSIGVCSGYPDFIVGL